MVAVASRPAVGFRNGDVVESRYQILRKLADGGMGTVYLAEHVLIRRRVALKLLHADLATDSTMVRRFMNEASAAGTLGHPHIVESTDMGFTRTGIPYIVFEYLEGSLLLEEVVRLRGLPVRRALQIASQVASALEAAHNAKIVHLDLKSDNVFLIDRGEAVDHVKVLDFGISRFMETDFDKTQRGVLAGTPEFMAPEQITMPDSVDGRADIYALGVLIYEMLTARCPHAHSDPRIVMHRVVHDPVPPLGRVVPEAVERLLFDRLLAKSRDQRLQTMRDVKAALDELAATLRPSTSEPVAIPVDDIADADADAEAGADASPEIEITFDEPSPAPVTPAPVPMAIAQPRRRRPPLWLPVTAAVVGLAGGGLWLRDQQDIAARDRAAQAALEADAGNLAAILAVEVRVARERVEDLAGTPMVRRAVDRNAPIGDRNTAPVGDRNAPVGDRAAASVGDRAAAPVGERAAAPVGDRAAAPAGDVVAGGLFRPRPGEAIELVRRAAPHHPVLRHPAGGPALLGDGAGDRFIVDDAGLRVVANAPVRTTAGELGGTLAFASPIDLGLIRRALGEHVLTASLVGLQRPLLLAGQPGAFGAPVLAPVAIDPALDAALGPHELSVFARIAPAAADEATIGACYASWTIAAVLLLIYALSWMSHGFRALIHRWRHADPREGELDLSVN